MADLLQKVFLVFTRPYYVTQTGQIIFLRHDAWIRIESISGGPPSYYSLITNNKETDPKSSPTKINSSGNYYTDTWMLHSSYTSYNQFRDALKGIVAFYGTNNVRCSVYVPIDYEVLPRE